MTKRNRNEGFSISYNEATHLYIAYSQRSHLYKVGITKNIHDRLRNLNSHRPDDSGDWRYVGYIKIGPRITGVIETQLATSLKRFNMHRHFSAKNGYCRELYSCPLDTILDALRYRLLPEEVGELNKSIKRFGTKVRHLNKKPMPFAKPRDEDNLNPRKKKQKGKKGKSNKVIRPRRTDLTPMAQLLQDKHDVCVYV
ncbi:GIY-YIG nuclease family protein [Vibrio sp. ZSDE26]|uniref:GIY-YIG nuclease family protein n=1 Tax=Vibrio amylolyticus TaxID=2847292 RepID=A0A9X2BLE4_9VIBR|nr:GIY-YIG nuclease family protein [Vibrio amylolyticus]MCK6263843.1 GIY-YIG nuclease family protein [Vibrio amylolyticus]